MGFEMHLKLRNPFFILISPTNLIFLKITSMNFPQDLKYTADHEWIRIEGNTATVGITDFAQDQLGDIVYVEVETVDETLEANETFGSVEAVKTVSDLFLPITGTITEFNEALNDQPDLVNQDPYGEGWMIKISFEEGVAMDHLLSVDQYQEEVANAS